MRVAVVGATGAVGSTMLGVMRERKFPADEVVPFASDRSVGRVIDYGDQELEVRGLSEEAIQPFDLALFSAGAAVSGEWAPRFAQAGAVVVDNSSRWRMNEGVPLVVSEVNPDDLAEHRGIVANPNCSTMQMVVALKPILDAAGRERVLVGRIREDPSHDRCLNLFIVGDNLRKGAATNAVQVAELLVARGLLRGSERRAA